MHPLAFPGEPGSTGALGMKSGDRLIHLPTRRPCVADEFLRDGDAFVTFDDGQYDTVKWQSLMPEALYHARMQALEEMAALAQELGMQ